MTDLGNTEHCPRGFRCESCGSERDDLTVQAAQTPLGELCLTLCPPCARSSEPPPITLATTINLVRQHGEHLRAACDG